MKKRCLKKANLNSNNDNYIKTDKIEKKFVAICDVIENIA